MRKDEFSADGRVWLPVSALPTTTLRHLISGVDPTITAVDIAEKPVTTGFTEWVGTWNNKTITVGWDWGIVSGDLVLINPKEIRSNVVLVSDERRALPAEQSRSKMLQWIDSLPWREGAIRDAIGDAKSTT